MKVEVSIRQDKMGNILFTDSRFPQREGFIQAEESKNQFFGDMGISAADQDHISRGYTFKCETKAWDTLEDYLGTETLDSFAPLCPQHKSRLTLRNKVYSSGQEYYCSQCDKAYEVINPDDYSNNFWGKNFNISVGPFGPLYLVNADCEQSAIDILIDYMEEHAPGYIMSHEEVDAEMDENGELEAVCGGNHGRYLNEEVHFW